MQLMHALLTQSVRVKLRHGRSLTGRLVAYDDHLNLMLSDVIETVIDAHGNTDKNQLQIVYVRGDLVILVAAH